MRQGYMTALDTGDYHELVARWFEEYRAPLFRYLVRLVGNEERAADVLQDTFVRAADGRRSSTRQPVGVALPHCDQPGLRRAAAAPVVELAALEQQRAHSGL